MRRAGKKCYKLINADVPLIQLFLTDIQEERLPLYECCLKDSKELSIIAQNDMNSKTATSSSVG